MVLCLRCSFITIIVSNPTPSSPPCQERKQRDNILPKLLASSAAKDPEELFKTELSKYNDLLADLDQNIQRQEQLLATVRVTQAKYKVDYGYVDWQRACSVCGVDEIEMEYVVVKYLGGSSCC